jgi:hypothetical protein
MWGKCVIGGEIGAGSEWVFPEKSEMMEGR